MKFTKATKVASHILQNEYNNNLALFESDYGNVSDVVQNLYNWIMTNGAEKWTIELIVTTWKLSYLG